MMNNILIDCIVVLTEYVYCHGMYVMRPRANGGVRTETVQNSKLLVLLYRRKSNALAYQFWSHCYSNWALASSHHIIQTTLTICLTTEGEEKSSLAAPPCCYCSQRFRAQPYSFHYPFCCRVRPLSIYYRCVVLLIRGKTNQRRISYLTREKRF